MTYILIHYRASVDALAHNPQGNRKMSELNVTSISELFKGLDLFESAANYEAMLEAEEQQQERIRIRAYSPEYYEWIGESKPTPPAPSAARQLVMESSHGKKCTCCKGTGQYHLTRSNTYVSCAKCAGKGYVTPIDEARSRAYYQRRTEGQPMDMSYEDYIH